MMGQFRKLVCKSSPAGITSWSQPSSTPLKCKHLSAHTNWIIKQFRMSIWRCLKENEKCKERIALGLINRENPTFSEWKKTFLSQVFSGRWFTRTCHPASLWELLCCCSDRQSAGWVAHPDGYVVDNKRSLFVSRTLNHHNCAVKNNFPNLILTWWSHQSVIFFAGVEPAQVQERVENHLKNLLIKHFDPQKADSIFTVEGEVRFLSHLFTIGLLINNIILKK